MMKANTKVCLLFKESHETLPDNYSCCEKRLPKLYNSLKNDTVLKKIRWHFS